MVLIDFLKAFISLVYLFSGPLAAWLVQRYTSRWVTAAGTVLIVVGVLSTAFAPSIYVLYITYGVLPGKSIVSQPQMIISAIFFQYNPLDPMDFTSNMRYFPRISQNSPKTVEQIFKFKVFFLDNLLIKTKSFLLRVKMHFVGFNPFHPIRPLLPQCSPFP